MGLVCNSLSASLTVFTLSALTVLVANDLYAVVKSVLSDFLSNIYSRNKGVIFSVGETFANSSLNLFINWFLTPSIKVLLPFPAIVFKYKNIDELK